MLGGGNRYRSRTARNASSSIKSPLCTKLSISMAVRFTALSSARSVGRPLQLLDQIWSKLYPVAQRPSFPDFQGVLSRFVHSPVCFDPSRSIPDQILTAAGLSPQISTPTGRPQFGQAARTTLLHEYIEPTLQRELGYRGIVNPQKGYSAELLAWVE